MQTQEVAKAYGAVCTPDFYLFKKVHPFAWHVLSMEGYLHGVWHMSLGRFCNLLYWILSPSELFGTLTSEDPTEDIPWNIRVRICRDILLRFLCFLAPSSAFECQYIVFLCCSTGWEETIWACIPWSVWRFSTTQWHSYHREVCTSTLVKLVAAWMWILLTLWLAISPEC